MDDYQGAKPIAMERAGTDDLAKLRGAFAEYLRGRKDAMVAEVDRVVDSALPDYESLPAEVVSDARRSFREFLQVYMDCFQADPFPSKYTKSLATDVGRRRAGQGLPLEAVIAGYDAGESYVWNAVTKELLGEGFSAAAWVELSKMRDRFNKAVRHYLSRAYVKEEQTSIGRQLEEFRAISNLGQTIVSTVDLEKVLGQILEVATSLMQTRMGTIMLLDSERRYFEAVTETGMSKSWSHKERIPVNASLSGVAIRRNEYVLARDDELTGFELPRAAAGRKIRSALSVPITVDDEPIGVIELYDTTPRSYTDLDITMLMAFGPQAGVAIKNARLFHEERRRRRQATTLTEVAMAASESRDLDEMLDTVVEKAAVALGADRCSLFLNDPEANALTFVAGYGRSTLQVWLLNQFHVPMSELEPATARAIRTGEPVQVEEVGEETSLEARIFRGPGVRSFLQVPLMVKDELIGLMSLELATGQARFSDDEITLADALARQAAVAIQNRRLQGKLFEQQLAIKNAEVNERLYREREKSEAVLKATPDAVFLVDRDMRVALINPAAEFLTGWSLLEAQGRNCHEVLYGAADAPGTCPGPECAINRVLSGEMVAFSEDELISRSGRQVPAGGTFAPIYGPDGKIENVVAVYRDISEQKELEKYALIQREMDIASGIQSSLLPRESLLAGGVGVYARQQQARLVGGDWYDYWSEGGKVFLVVGDASGAGVGAALFATMAMSALRVEAREHGDMMEIIEHANTNLFLANQSESFVTVFFAVLDLATMTLNYVNAGHEEPLCIGAEDRTPEPIESDRRSLLGIFQKASLGEKSRKMNSGERLVIFTDGVIDAKNSRNKFYGLKRLQRFVSVNRDLPAGEFIDTLVENVLDFCERDPKDDLTVMVCDIP